MKKKVLLSIVVILYSTIISFGQISLTYENHALKAGEIHETQQAEYKTSGKAGANIVWDFSDLQCIGSHATSVLEASQTVYGSEFSHTNIAVEEVDKYFYFNISETENNYFGIMSENNVIHFDQPVTKMKYPFTFGDNFSGTFTGSGLYAGEIPTNVEGFYKAECDAFGTIILPGNSKIENVIRVKYYQEIIETGYCSVVQTATTKYFWYSLQSRYPIVSILETTTQKDSEQPVETRKLYFKDNVLPTTQPTASSLKEQMFGEYKLACFPNPFTDFINIDFSLNTETKVDIRVFDVIGKEMHSIVANKNLPAGKHHYTFNCVEQGLVSGSYYVRFEADGVATLEKIVSVE